LIGRSKWRNRFFSYVVVMRDHVQPTDNEKLEINLQYMIEFIKSAQKGLFLNPLPFNKFWP